VGDVEPTAAGPVDADAPLIPDLEPTAVDAPLDATPLPTVVVCRYCRTPAAPGERLCGRCGMRLPVVEAPRREEPPPHALCSCGAPITAAKCPACGARHGSVGVG
jgi:hypothetical protein